MHTYQHHSYVTGWERFLAYYERALILVQLIPQRIVTEFLLKETDLGLGNSLISVQYCNLMSLNLHPTSGSS